MVAARGRSWGTGFCLDRRGYAPTCKVGASGEGNESKTPIVKWEINGNLRKVDFLVFGGSGQRPLLGCWVLFRQTRICTYLQGRRKRLFLSFGVSGVIFKFLY